MSLTFDDGWLSHYDEVLPILDNGGVKGTFYIVTKLNQYANPENNAFELDADSNNQPDDWFTGSWGTNVTTFSYPVTGVSGSNAAKVEMTSWTDGDAKWYFADVPVLTDQIYTFRDQYQSNTETRVVVRITRTDNSEYYDDVGTAPASTEWAPFVGTFYVPVDAKSVTVFHLLDSVGYLTIDDASLGITTYVTKDQILAMQADGQEIGSHTQTHPSLISLDPAAAQVQIAGASADLTQIGINQIRSLAYPYGDYNAQIQQYAQDAGLTSARTVQVGFNTKSTDRFGLLTQNIDATTTLDEIKAWIDTAKNDHSWLILTFHQVDTSGSDYGTTPGMLQNIVDYLNASSVPVKTMSEGIALF